MVPGLRVGGVIGQCEDCKAANKDLDEETFFATYAYGPLSIGYQVAEVDDGTKNYDTDIYGVSFNVNDALSVSYQYGETTGYGGSIIKQNSKVFLQLIILVLWLSSSLIILVRHEWYIER
jgi:hypothetical protein